MAKKPGETAVSEVVRFNSFSMDLRDALNKNAVMNDALEKHGLTVNRIAKILSESLESDPIGVSREYRELSGFNTMQSVIKHKLTQGGTTDRYIEDAMRLSFEDQQNLLKNAKRREKYSEDKESDDTYDTCDEAV